MARNNAKNDEALLKTVRRNFYMDDFIKSVKISQEGIDVYHRVREVLSRGGFKLTKWITSDEDVKSQIPEEDRPTKAVKILEVES